MNQRKPVLSIAVLVLTAVACAWPQSASADVARVGATFTAVDVVSTRYSDIAYDPVNDVYLTVAQAAPGGVLTAFGRFVSAAGTPLGAQQFTFTGNGGKPRVAYGNGKFLVTWYDYRATKGGQVVGRFATYDPATGGAALGPEFIINTAAGFLNTETSSPVSAYSTVSDEFLVVWMDQGGVPASDVRGQRISSAGAPLGALILITYDNNWQADPAVAYNASANMFYVAWANYVDASRTGGIHGRRVQAGTGNLPEQYTILFNSSGTWIPNVVNNPIANNFLVGWYTATPEPTHYAQVVGTDGVPVGSPTPVVFCTGPANARVCYASYDGFSIAHNTATNTYIAVLHGRGTDDVGTEILPTGVPTSQGVFGVTDAGARKGSYYPKIAASTTSARWMLTTATDFLRESAQVLESTTNAGGGPPPPPPPPPPPDPTEINFTAAVNGTEYFAEGVATADSFAFKTTYQIENANDVPASVRMYFAKQNTDGTVTLKERAVTAPARSRTTVDLAAQVGNGPWSALFQSLTAGAPTTTQQTLYWGNAEGSSSETAVRAPSTQWLFAEGSRVQNDFFSNYFLLFNPNAQTISVLGEYFGPNSTTPIIKSYTVPPFSRYTIYANGEIPDFANLDFSTRFRAADGVSTFVAQRAMYWGTNWTGGHSSVGASAVQPTWLFAEGAAAPGFDTWFTLLNPNDFEVTVNITYLTEFAGAKTTATKIAAKSRKTVSGNGDLAALGVPNVGAFGTTFNTVGGHGIIVERSIYWGPDGNFRNWVEGTNDVGVNAPAQSWDLPEGSDADTQDTYILVANPNGFPVDVQLQFFLEDSRRITVPAVTVAANGRLTIDMSSPRTIGLPTLDPDDAALLKNKSFSARVNSLTDGGAIIVEEAIYRNWTPSARWRAGASAFGIPR